MTTLVLDKPATVSRQRIEAAYREIEKVEPALTTQMFTLASACVCMVTGHTIKPPLRVGEEYQLPPYHIEYRVGVLQCANFTKAVNEVRWLLARRYSADGYVRSDPILTFWRKPLDNEDFQESLRFLVTFSR